MRLSDEQIKEAIAAAKETDEADYFLKLACLDLQEARKTISDQDDDLAECKAELTLQKRLLEASRVIIDQLQPEIERLRAELEAEKMKEGSDE